VARRCLVGLVVLLVARCGSAGLVVLLVVLLVVRWAGRAGAGLVAAVPKAQ